jgi:hypothetical protein
VNRRDRFPFGSQRTTLSLTLHQSAAVIGGHCWIERRLFERLGSWAAPSASDAAKLLLDAHSQHAAWRAGQWWDRLPVLAQLDREELVAPDDAWAALVAEAGAAAPAGLQPAAEVAGVAGSRAGADGAGAADPGTADVRCLAIAYRVLLPRLAARYERHAAMTTPMADGPVIRTLRQVAADIRFDWAEGEFLLKELISSGAHAAAAAAAVAAAELAVLPPVP